MTQSSWISELRPLIVMPTYNEAENLPLILNAIFKNFPEIQVLVVDDQSPDGTGDLADRLSSEQSRLHVLHREKKQGLGPAYLAGFQWALERDYQRIIEMDADFSHPPEFLPKMLRASFDYPVVIGSRYVQGGRTEDWGLIRRWISRGGSFYARTILGLELRDLTAGFVCWDRVVLEHLELDDIEASGYGFQIEMKARAIAKGFEILEIPIRFPDRQRGESKMSLKIASEALFLVWKLYFKLRKSHL